MVAPSYSLSRSQLAKAFGLGRKAEPAYEPENPGARPKRKKLGLKIS
ncbi:hypothetical protein [Mesorhizobium sp. M0618]